ncbi:hypothetical protein ACSYAY_01285 [Leptospirillum ferriphilum]|uniref:Uncharacterized protein n=1 Tax=Leptospirillum ferriphilum TaxID=178606 RepID=A0A1V3SV71_9BACT|nr:hypothetical protein [Leptospirillum ferriphilum]OOH72763.1 hypothetical protein BOX24_05085 [Leptospirillum ferriphilum]
MPKILSVILFALAMVFISPLFASAAETNIWILWEEVITTNAILYPNSQSPSTNIPFGEAMAFSVFSSRDQCERKQSEMADKGMAIYIYLPP